MAADDNNFPMSLGPTQKAAPRKGNDEQRDLELDTQPLNYQGTDSSFPTIM